MYKLKAKIINNYRVSFPLSEKACFFSPNVLMSTRSNLCGKKQTWTFTDKIPEFEGFRKVRLHISKPE